MWFYLQGRIMVDSSRLKYCIEIFDEQGSRPFEAWRKAKKAAHELLTNLETGNKEGDITSPLIIALTNLTGKIDEQFKKIWENQLLESKKELNQLKEDIVDFMEVVEWMKLDLVA